MKDNPNEIQFLNTAKVIGIFLVIYAHLSIPQTPYIFINSFHMPLFFCISGYFVSTSKYTFKDFFIRKFRTLIVPYFIFAIVSLFFELLIGQKYGNNANTHPDISKYIAGIFLAIPSRAYLGFNIPLWFLPALFSIEIIFYLYRKYFHRYSWITVICSFLIGILLKHTLPFRLPWGIDVALFAMPFVQIGYYLKRKNLNDAFFIRMNFTAKSSIILTSAILTLLFSTVNIRHNSGVLVYALQFNNYFLFFAAACTGIIFTFMLSSCIPASGLVRFYGRNTIILLGLHFMAYSVVKGLLHFIFQIPMEIINGNAYLKLFISVGDFIVLTPVIYCVNKYTPQLLGRKKAV
ncbi:MAG: acyltransferase family protein [Dysgonamonadaceae bacterium]|jgi:fucose 4-O-acetylase-like acetyltransferase|nr:acyltransferase family protein [Dysgonamonadaceae bacterium]